MRYFIELSYNGKSYFGWQIQPDAITVQETLEKALSTVLRETIAIVGAGRTDANVHASQMFAHFNTDLEIDESQLKYKLNGFLPKDIAIHNIFKVKADAHARFDAESRSYIYRITQTKNVFNTETTYYIKYKLDIDKMKEACKILFQYQDFQCFSKVHTDVKTYICDIKHANWVFVDDELQFHITANRFLRNMVRAIVGTMLEIGSGKLNLEDLHAIIKSKNRSKAGFSVPGHALFLSQVAYPETIIL